MGTVVKVALGIVLGVAALIVGCTALVGSSIEEAEEEQQRQGITRAQFRGIELGATARQVRRRLGRPTDAQRFEQAGIEGLTEPTRSSCIYYGERGKGLLEGATFQLCFTDGQLDSKNAY